jgi:hypothetical protein
VREQPAHADAINLLGAIALQTGDARRAADLFEQAMLLDASNVGACSNHALALWQLGQLEGALASYDQVVALKSDLSEAHFNRGQVLYQLGRSEAALDSFERAITAEAGYAEAHERCAALQCELGRWDAALQDYDQVIGLVPDYEQAHFGRANVHAHQKRWDLALADYDRALEIRPDYAEAHSNRGVVLWSMGCFEAAAASHCQALQLRPGHAESYADLGNALQGLGRLEPAVASYRQALEIRADLPEVHYNLGVALTDLKKWDASMDCYERAISLRPGFTEAHRNRAMLQLLLGNFEDGWQEYEWRRKMNTSEANRGFAQPLWLGDQPLGGKTILLYGEQGLGDTLQFCRYARWVAQLGAEVQLEVQAPLTGLLTRLDGVSRVISRGESLPDVDYQCALLSLPLAFKTRIDTIPSSIRYLDSDRAKVQHWQALLSASPGENGRPRIGLAWSGNPRHRNDRRRNITLEQLLERLPPGPRYVSLQKDVRPEDWRTLQSHPEVLSFAEELRDFNETAALCECLDLVISVDTSVAHLSCALGKRSWILLPFVPDWRWLLDRVDSPWYPTARLYRQQRQEDWGSVLQRIADDLNVRYHLNG